ncbi:MAG: phage tail protein [Halodesulfovibrio sp.]|uniref:phage tail protein n=1 Tax=Halodesulfovibrio sp. TaxID=1912772 RepID=UPI00359DE6C5
MRNRLFRIALSCLVTFAIFAAVTVAQAEDSTSFDPTVVTVKLDDSGTPIGTIAEWSSSSPPKGWLPCDGRSTSGYPKLSNIIGASVPDLSGQFVIGSGVGRSVGSKQAAKSSMKLYRQTSVQNSDRYDGDDRKATISSEGEWSQWGLQSGQGASMNQVGSGNNESTEWTKGKVRYKLEPLKDGGPANVALMYIIKAK